MRTQYLTRDPARDLLRSMGGLLFAAGALALELRKATSWGSGGRMLALLIPAVVLYVLALGVVDRRKRDAAGIGVAEPWQSVLMVFAVILNVFWLKQFFSWVGAHGTLVTAGVFALTAISAGYAAWRANVRYAALLSALSLLIAWLALWEKILDHPSGTTIRWLLIIIAVIFIAAAVGLTSRTRRDFSEVVTVAGIAGVAAASEGVFRGIIAVAASRLSSGGGLPSFGAFNVKQQFIWDLILLLIVLALIWHGSRARVRGPGYVGALGLVIFLFSVGYQLAARLAGNTATGSVVGWPLALLLIGAAALVVGFLAARIAGPIGPEDRVPPPAASPPPPPAVGSPPIE